MQIVLRSGLDELSVQGQEAGHWAYDHHQPEGPPAYASPS